MPRIKFGETETLTIADLRVGDFVELIPTQSGVRGLKIDSGIATIVRKDVSESIWKYGQPRHRVAIESTHLTFHRTGASVVSVPDNFTVKVRRQLASVEV